MPPGVPPQHDISSRTRARSNSCPLRATTPHQQLGRQSSDNILGLDFKIPDAVKQSTTADIVNFKKPDSRDSTRVSDFNSLRNAYETTSSRQMWYKELQYFRNTFKNSANSTIPLGPLCVVEKNLWLARDAYESRLALISSQTNIWNCQELADHALITISHQLPGLLLSPIYKAEIVSLNNFQIPTGEFFNQGATIGAALPLCTQQLNHDHVFLAIFNNRLNEAVYIIDLWQRFVRSSNFQPFIGTCDEYVSFLNKVWDGRYIVKNVTKTDIQKYTDVQASRRLTSDSASDRGPVSYDSTFQGTAFYSEAFGSATATTTTTSMSGSGFEQHF